MNVPGFQGVNKPFELSFENKADRRGCTGYYFPKPELKDYNIMIDERHFFDQPVRNDINAYENIRKIANDQRVLLDCLYFKEK